MPGIPVDGHICVCTYCIHKPHGMCLYVYVVCVYVCDMCVCVCCDSGMNVCMCENKLVVVQQESKDLKCKFLVSVSHNHLISLF